jgi:hypothetical protein
MRTLLVKLFLLALVAGFCQPLQAQDLTGIWRGYFITESGDQYKLEFQIEQKGASTVTGVSYSYLDTRFYGKATMTGVPNLKNSRFTIQELRTVEVRNLGGGSTCLMNYSFTYARSGKEEFLEGRYMGKTEDRANPRNNGQWGDCGGGTVYLRRVTTSDFPLEAFLRNRQQPQKQTETTKVNPKPATPPVVKRTTPAPRKPATVPPSRPDVAMIPEKEPAKQELPPVKERPAPKLIAPPVETRDRRNELVQTLSVSNNEISIRLYDNGEIDNDTISLYLDGRLVLSNKRLSASPITYTLQLSEEEPEHTLVMVAENLGRIPPNTSLMIVQDGDRRYQVSITSTEQKNAMVRFRYRKP